MKSGLLFLPFLALLFSAVGTLFTQDFKWVSWAGWGLGLLLIGLWVALDFNGFRTFFHRKGAKYGASSGMVVILGLAVIIGAASVSMRPRFNKSIDFSRDNLNTISSQSVQVIETIAKRKADIQISAFFADPEVERQFRDLVTLYQSKGANFAVQFSDPRVQPEKALEAKLTNANTVIIRLGDQESRLTTFTEEKFTNGILKVLKDKTRKIYFMTGHGEGQLKGEEAAAFGSLATELENSKFAVDEFSLLEKNGVPPDADLVVIGGPKYDFTPEETKLLEDYLKLGRPLLVMVDALIQVPNLNKFLMTYGLKYESDFLILNDARAQFLSWQAAIISEFDEFHPIGKDFSRGNKVDIVAVNSRTISEVAENPASMKFTAVGKSSKTIVRAKDIATEQDLLTLLKNPDADRSRLDQGDFAVIAAVTGRVPSVSASDASAGEAPKDKELRIVAMGSSQVARNRAFGSGGQYRDLIINSIEYLMQDEDFISIRPKDPAKSSLAMENRWAGIHLGLISIVYPFLFLGGGIFYWLRRRNQ